MPSSALIIGYGSIGQRHASILKKKFKLKKIFILTKRRIKGFLVIKNILEIKKLNIDYIIISSPTSKHFKHLKFIEKNLKHKKILVEKPLFEKFRNLKIKKNKVFVGYNLRFHPLIKYVKKNFSNKKIIDIKILCNSYLPNWRKNINYTMSSSAHKSQGGGVILDLSHELDYVRWLFGEISLKFTEKGKFSKLSINTEDHLKLYGLAGKANLSLDLNYYSRIPKRIIFVNGENFTIFIDLIKNEAEIQNKNVYFVKKLSNFNDNYTYIQQHKEILSNRFKNVCSYTFAKDTMKLIDKIKNWRNN